MRKRPGAPFSKSANPILRGVEMQVGQGLDALFMPRSIAVIGASQAPTKIGGRPLHLLQKFGFPGAIYPVNRTGGDVQGLPAYASLDDLPAVPDLAVIAVPAAAVLEAVEACAARGVRAAVVLSAGFSEMGEDGARLQGKIGDVARRAAMRVVGPNCLGTIGIAERSIATFSIVLDEALPVSGRIGIVSQSGNLGSFAMKMAMERGVGISRFITTGNECDVDLADGIAWMARDPETHVILCCMETCRDAPRFVEALKLAREAGKPVIALKIGHSLAGSRAAASHTGALAGSDAVFDAVLRNAGAIRVSSIEQLMNVGHAADIVGKERLPRGNRVALMAASGGFGVMLADAASVMGLALPSLAEATQKTITGLLPYASAQNPVDTTAEISARPELLSGVLNGVLSDENCDVAILHMSSSLFVERLASVYLNALENIRRMHPDKLLVLSCRGPAGTLKRIQDMGFPTVDGIDAVCSTVASLVRMGTQKAEIAADPLPAAPIALDAEAFGNEFKAKAALAAAGVPVLEERIAADVDAAVAAARDIGFPVAIKILSSDIAHKTEVGGVVLGLENEEALSIACAEMLTRVRVNAPAARLDGILVAQMAGEGVELIVGAKRDPIFGPVVLVGVGGIFAEILQDVSLQIAPVSKQQALAMLQSLKAFALLDGARGRPQADIASAVDVIVAVSRFAALHAETVSEIDINPLLVRVLGQGAVALDALLIPAEKKQV